ncbi:hypothetical protein CRE_05545 [Caenorhabditis remanei]|uniref:Uncharacterized protein n=1 Tax=Caenorhabditis remanei TaxID=31234 RepID=E3LZV7_CAERE|nr:hypothetical protein CRE_05545 [Caenorhabditis remanei]
MADLKLSFLGFLIINSFFLNLTGIFTSNWVIGSSWNQGLVLNDDNVNFFAAIFMFVTLAVSVILVIMYSFIYFQTRDGDYPDGLRKWFRINSLFSVVNVILTSIAIILVRPVAYRSEYYTLGFSAWLCLISSVMATAIAATSVYIASEEF